MSDDNINLSDLIESCRRFFSSRPNPANSTKPLHLYWISLRKGGISFGILTDWPEKQSGEELLESYASAIERETGRKLSEWTAFVVYLGVLPVASTACADSNVWDEVHGHARWSHTFGYPLKVTEKPVRFLFVKGSEPENKACFPTPRPQCNCSVCERFWAFWKVTDEDVVSGPEYRVNRQTVEHPTRPLLDLGERHQSGPRQLFWINLRKGTQSWGILSDWPGQPNAETILNLCRSTIEEKTQTNMEELTAFLVDLGTLSENPRVCADATVFDNVHPHHAWTDLGYVLARTDRPVRLFAKKGDRTPDSDAFYPTPRPNCCCELCAQLRHFWETVDRRPLLSFRYTNNQSSVSVSIHQHQEPQEQENDMTAVSITTPTPTPTEITRRGDQLILPEGMTYKEAIDLIQRRATYEEKETIVVEQLDAFPLDGAHALNVVLTQLYGWVEGIPTPGFFGDTPPVMIAVQTAINRKINVPWGDIRLPNVKGVLTIGAQKKDGRFVSVLSAKIRRGDEPIVRDIFARVGAYLQTNSIYQGKAIAVRFFDNEGDPLPMPEPTFMDTSIDEESLIFSEDMERMVRVNLLTPIERHKDLVANSIPLKRGVLLAGTYGTGKTLSAKLASKLAVEAGITFVYVRHAKELAHTIQFARAYSNPAVVIFCEDIDSVTDGKRDADLNDILNTIDGVDTKGMNLITLLTTNHIERITTAMLRPGRLDAVIMVGPPDQQARVKLIRYYGGSAIAKDADLEVVASELDGAIPAVIAEVVKRAKLHQLALQKPGTPILKLTTDALLGSARTMIHQRKLLETAEQRDREAHERIRSERQPLSV